MHEGHL